MALVRAAESEQDAAIYLTAAFTGLRQGELLALRWRDVDFELELVRVRANFTHGREGSPKSGRERAVPMMTEVAQALARLSRRDRFTASADLVFCSQIGDHISPKHVAARYRKGARPRGVASTPLPRPSPHVRHPRHPRRRSARGHGVDGA